MMGWKGTAKDNTFSLLMYSGESGLVSAPTMPLPTKCMGKFGLSDGEPSASAGGYMMWESEFNDSST